MTTGMCRRVGVAFRAVSRKAQDEVTADELALSGALLLPLSAAFDFSSSEAYRPCS